MKIRVLLFLVIFISVSTVHGQEPIYLADSTFSSVGQLPEFPGGESSLLQFLAKNVHYPKEARESGVQGRAVVHFVVDTKGNIEQITMIEGLHPTIEKEIIRVVKAMPKWKPGRLNGKTVKLLYTLPVSFRIK